MHNVLFKNSYLSLHSNIFTVMELEYSLNALLQNQENLNAADFKIM